MLLSRTCASLLLALAVAMPLSAQAQTAPAAYPVKSLRFIAPFPTGASQILAHLVSERLAESLGQPVVVDYRPGGGGNIGAEIAAKAPPDGYTLVMLSSSHATSPGMYKSLKYDVLKDFTPVSVVAAVPNVLVAHPSLPAKTLKELAAIGRAHPGKLTFGSGGVGSSNHLASELFVSLAKAKMVHVPYKGASIALTSILAGEADFVVVTVPATIPFINAGRLRGIAVLDRQRVPTLPNVPTTAESGMPELLLTTWYGIAVPAGTRADIVERLGRELIAVAKNPDVRARLAKVGIDGVGNTPQEFADFLRDEVTRWTRVIRAADIRVE